MCECLLEVRMNMNSKLTIIIQLRYLILGIILDIMMMICLFSGYWTPGPNMTGKYNTFEVNVHCQNKYSKAESDKGISLKYKS